MDAGGIARACLGTTPEGLGSHCRTGRIWAYCSQHGTVYDATADRSRDGPLAFLQGYQGFLQCDAYAGHDELFRRSNGTIIEVG